MVKHPSLDIEKDVPSRLTKEPGAFLLHEMRGEILTHSIPVGQFDGPTCFTHKKTELQFY